MNLTDCPEAVRAYLTLTAGDDHEAALVAFAENAKVTDDGHDYSGAEDIRGWLTRTSTEFSYTRRPLSAVTSGDETTVTCRVEGNFPGSPVDLDHHFRLDDTRRISRLEIRVHVPAGQSSGRS